MTRGPRVVYLCSWPIGARGEGALSFVYEQIDALADHVEGLYVEHRFASIPDWARRWITGRSVEPIHDLWDPKRVTALSLSTPRTSTRITRRTLLDDIARAAKRVARQIIRTYGQPDLVHAHVVLPAGVLAAEIARELRIPLVLQEHSGPFEMHLDSEEKVRWVRHVFDAAWRILAVGSDLARRMQAEGASPEKVVVLPNLVSTERFTARAPISVPPPLQLVSVGSLVRVKRLDLLIRALAILRASGLDVHLSIVGDGWMRDELSFLAASLGVADHVTFRGQLSRSETANALAASHLYVCSSEVETFGLAPAEALAIGRPVVTTACGGPEYYVGEQQGRVIHTAEPTDIARAVMDVAARLSDYEPSQLHAYVDKLYGSSVFRPRVLGLYAEAMQRPAIAERSPR